MDLCSDTLTVSDSIDPNLATMVESYGLEVSNFCIAAMLIDENDPNRRILEQVYAKYSEKEIM